MREHVKTLQNIVSRKRSGKVLTFSSPHVFKALRLLMREKYVSRATFCNELHMGEGAVKTMISHFKFYDLADSVRAGTFLKVKGRTLAQKFFEAIPTECNITTCNIAKGKHNWAILLRGYSKLIENGIEQRDFAILYGASGATTLIYDKGKFVFPGETVDCLEDDQMTKRTLIDKLHPKNKDVVIISSADEPFVAEIAAINSVLWTIVTAKM